MNKIPSFYFWLMSTAFPGVLFCFGPGCSLLGPFILLTEPLQEEIFGERFSTQNNGRKDLDNSIFDMPQS